MLRQKKKKSWKLCRWDAARTVWQKKGEPLAERAGFAVLCHVEKWFRK